jgi:hypothetical protein
MAWWSGSGGINSHGGIDVGRDVVSLGPAMTGGTKMGDRWKKLF